MKRSLSLPLIYVAFALLGATAVARFVPPAAAAEPSAAPLRIVVMDPLAAPLSCACVKGQGQRDYGRLARFLEHQLGREVELVFEESLGLAYQRAGREFHLIVGKRSVVEFDARQSDTSLKRLLMLSDRQGRTQHSGLFLVRAGDAAKSVAELKGRRVVLAPAEHDEAHAAAKRRLAKAGIAGACRVETAGSMEEGVFAVADGEADAALVSDWLPPLLEGCGKVAAGSLRSIGRTDSVPFIGVFATSRLAPQDERRIREALLNAGRDKDLLEALESKRGFVGLEDAEATQVQPTPAPEQATQGGNVETEATSWADWRGPDRRGWCAALPKSLPEQPRIVWQAEVTGPALAGIAATDKLVVAADKDAELKTDVFRCFDADTGRVKWTLRYGAAGKVEYTNAPRATPVIHDGKVFLQGALGDLHCVALESGRVIWKRNILTDFGAEPLTWGCSTPPLVFDDKLLVTPGAKDASLAALNRETGELAWKAPGHAAAYAPFIIGTFGGVRQLVGYDVAGLGGWDPGTGRRLWEMIPPGLADFNVVTPVAYDGGVILATENNATRLYRFGGRGVIRQKPVRTNDDFAPDTCSPVVVGDRLYGAAYGELFCLNLARGLKTVWVEQDDIFFDHSNLIAGNGRVLIWTTTGDLLLIRADVDRYELVSRLRPIEGEGIETMSHPAIVGRHLYLRSQQKLVCLDIGEADR